jgi:hypothetical protein
VFHIQRSLLNANPEDPRGAKLVSLSAFASWNCMLLWGVRKIFRFGCLLPLFPSYSYIAIFATASHPIHVARQVRLFSPILEMSGLALERDMDTLFSNLPIIRHRFKY